MIRVDERNGQIERYWRRYFYVHSGLVLWIVAVPIASSFLIPETMSDFVSSLYLFMLALSYPLAWLLPLATIRLLVLSRLEPNAYLLMSVLDAVLCAVHFQAIMAACM